MLRINVWISFNGIGPSRFKGKYPYEAVSLVTNKKRVFESIEDVYEEIEKLYSISQREGYELGKSLYSQCAFFTDYETLLSAKHQTTIKEYSYCKTFSCSPYPSMQETPSYIVNDFMIIEQEYNSYSKKEERNVKK